MGAFCFLISGIALTVSLTSFAIAGHGPQWALALDAFTSGVLTFVCLVIALGTPHTRRWR